MKMLSLDQIDQSTNRLPFTDDEMRFLVSFIKSSWKKGRDVRLDPTLMGTRGDEIFSIASDGFIVINSAALDLKLLFAKVDAGKGLFGGQKAAFISYLCSLSEMDWTIGTTFKSWPIAVTSIGNIYRGTGLR